MFEIVIPGSFLFGKTPSWKDKCLLFLAKRLVGRTSVSSFCQNA